MKIFKIIAFLALMFNSITIFASWVDHFNIKFNKTTASVWEALDITITAVDKNDNIVPNYEWTITAFSETDDKVELPKQLSNDEWFKFTEENQWEIKFENAVKFSEKWKQSLSVYNLDSTWEIIWTAEINIEWWEPVEKKIDIEILTPESWLTIWTSKIKVSWKTKKNHNVLIKLNNEKEFNTISNSVWIFEKEINWLENWENFIKAYVLDANWEIKWKTWDVRIKVNSILPSLKKITISPLNDNWETDASKTLNVKVNATKWLKDVSLIINDSIITLEETADWVYTWELQAPSKAWKYSVDVILKDHIWHTKEKKNIETFTVIENDNWNEQQIKEIKNDWLNSMKISWLKVVTLKTKSVLTWNKVEKAKWYKIYKKVWNKYEYIDSVKNPKFEIEITWDKIKYDYFKVKAIWEKINNETWKKENYEWDLSEATKIKTWPEIIILLLISLMFWFWIFIFKRKKQY